MSDEAANLVFQPSELVGEVPGRAVARTVHPPEDELLVESRERQLDARVMAEISDRRRKMSEQARRDAMIDAAMAKLSDEALTKIRDGLVSHAQSLELPLFVIETTRRLDLRASVRMRSEVFAIFFEGKRNV